jgi:hypothetical protein
MGMEMRRHFIKIFLKNGDLIFSKIALMNSEDNSKGIKIQDFSRKKSYHSHDKSCAAGRGS